MHTLGSPGYDVSTSTVGNRALTRRSPSSPINGKEMMMRPSKIGLRGSSTNLARACDGDSMLCNTTSQPYGANRETMPRIRWNDDFSSKNGTSTPTRRPPFPCSACDFRGR